MKGLSCSFSTSALRRIFESGEENFRLHTKHTSHFSHNPKTTTPELIHKRTTVFSKMSHSSLSAAADERKARLLQLKSLKRKAPPSFDEDLTSNPPPSPPPAPSIAQLHLSGRNYDPETKGPKLGFENTPLDNLDKPTLEEEAAAIEREVREKREEEERKAQSDVNGGGGLDLEQLRPKKPNWDLKRDLERKMEVLGVRTDNAIARIVRERIEGARARVREKGEGKGKDGDGEEVGMEGVSLVESVRQLEREDEEDERRLGGDVEVE